MRSRSSTQSGWAGLLPTVAAASLVAVASLAAISPAAAAPSTSSSAAESGESDSEPGDESFGPHADEKCGIKADPLIGSRTVPWAQRRLEPARAWPFSTGDGVTVAVVGTGVDGAHPQLAGRVLPGYDLLTETRTGDFDCESHGTAAASLIVAKCQPEEVGLCGMSPGAKILPIRAAASSSDTISNPRLIASRLASAVDRAVAGKAGVILLTLSVDEDEPSLRSAVKRAVGSGAVVIAPAGNNHDGGLPVEPTPYPAAYPDVIGVAAIDETGNRTPGSRAGPWVDLVAPGGLLLAASRVSGYNYVSGTEYAAAFVAGAAALLLAATPGMPVSGVTGRLLTTTSGSRGATRDDVYGFGEVDPYRALTQGVVTAAPAPVVMPSRSIDPAAVAWAQRWQDIRRSSGKTAILGLVLLLLVVALGTGVSPAFRRRMTANRAARIEEPAREELQPSDLFAVPPAFEAQPGPSAGRLADHR